MAGTTPSVRVRPIEEIDLGPVGDFLHRELNGRLSAQTWSDAARSSWSVDQPNFGFCLEQNGEIVGANLAFYSERASAGTSVRFCNLGALAVVEEQRVHALRLVRALLRQPGYSFTDLSPSRQVVDIDRRLGFRPVDTTTAFVVNRLSRSRGPAELVTDPQEIEGRLAPAAERRIFDDHRSALGARHLLLTYGDRQCYVVYRRDRRKRLPTFATLLHVSDAELYLEARPLVDAHLLRQGALVTLVELRVLGGRAPTGARLYEGRPKMVKSDVVAPGDVDDLYSELTLVPW